MKRVVIDVNSVMPLYGRGWLSGIGRTTKELIEALDCTEALPFEVMLYSQNTKGTSGERLQSHFRCRHIGLPHKAWMNRLVGMSHLREWSTGYDLLHIPHNFEWVRRPDRTVVTMHDAMFFSYPDEVHDHAYARRVYPTLARQCRAIITCSESSKRDIMRFMDIRGDKIHVCPWGYRKDLFFPRPTATTTPYFLSVSCSLGRKNTMAVIRAFEKMLRNGPTHRLVLVWPNAPHEVKEYCDRTPLRNHIEIADNVDDMRLAELYNGATATFFPSRYEGFGLPVLESMACGTPVVTCRNSALPEVGGKAALYVEPDDIDAMCGYMEMFELGAFDKEILKRRCLEQSAPFTWERCAQQMISIYNELLN